MTMIMFQALHAIRSLLTMKDKKSVQTNPFSRYAKDYNDGISDDKLVRYEYTIPS